MPLNLKQAVEYLASTPTPYKMPTLRKAIESGKLKTELIQSYPLPYRVVELEDLKAWAEQQSKSIRGNPAWRKT